MGAVKKPSAIKLFDGMNDQNAFKQADFSSYLISIGFSPPRWSNISV
jgi:hypothetical protein